MREINWKLAGMFVPALLLLGACGITESGNKENHAVEMKDAGDMGQNTSDKGTLTVTFLDVGQGNAVLVESDGAYMLINGGDREYSSFVVSYLKNVGVDELEYVISSHYDAEHLNGVVGVLNAFSCETVLASGYVTDTRVYRS